MPPDRAQKLQERLLATFRIEAAEHLGVLGAELEALGDDPTATDERARLEVLFRTMHTLKGAARSVGLGDVEKICHLCESLLRSLREGNAAVPVPAIRDLQEACDAIAALVGSGLSAERLDAVTDRLTAMAAGSANGYANAGLRRERHAPPAIPAATTVVEATRSETTERPAEPRPAPASDARFSSIRVEVDRLERFNVLAEDLMVPKLAAADRVRMARSLGDELARVRAGLRAETGRGSAVVSREARNTALAVDNALRDVQARVRRLSAALRNDHKVLRSGVDALFEELRHIRMMPATTMLEAFPAMVRDLARETGKEVVWRLTGGDMAIDRKVLDLIKDPLIHIVRNAIDHGIETPAERTQAGKPRQGTVSVAFRQTGSGRVAIYISDDGRGLDASAICKAAVRARALPAEQEREIGNEAVLDLIFRAGVSTSPVISSISGHGLGLAIVRERVERIEGRLTVETAAGAGVTIGLELPTTIATYRGLLVGACGRRILWPFDAIERAIGIPRQKVAASIARGSYTFQNRALPIGRLAAVFALGGSKAGADTRLRQPAIVVRSGDRRGILLVDEVFGESEVVIKEIRPPLLRIRNVLTSGILGTGELVLVARPSDVLGSIRAGTNVSIDAPRVSSDRVLRVLIVDDSITTRTMERNLFEAAGYQARTAADGLEALGLLQNEPFDLVISDVDMPQMDGFELTERVRRNDKFAQLPVVLVTALETREDKERGIRVGANAYVLKSAFNQSNLLEIVRRLT